MQSCEVGSLSFANPIFKKKCGKSPDGKILTTFFGAGILLFGLEQGGITVVIGETEGTRCTTVIGLGPAKGPIPSLGNNGL